LFFNVMKRIIFLEKWSAELFTYSHGHFSQFDAGGRGRLEPLRMPVRHWPEAIDIAKSIG
jgi:hypothetical protein